MKTCGFTGHRRIPADRIELVRCELQREVEQAVADGYTRFLCGFADGADLEFAAIVAEVKPDNPAISLEAAIPYRERLDKGDPLFRSLLERCDRIHVVREEFSPDCYKARNAFIVENAERMIAVFDGRFRSGTAQTVRMSEKARRELRVIGV